MKTWDESHPKARLMERKRGDILRAARSTFLERGFDGTNMEAIAATADVSIMTLYRHAESKDELFAAVVADLCDPDRRNEAERYAAIMELPLAELLLATATEMQETLTGPETVALIRMVIAEAKRFPQLAELAYRGLVQRLENVVAEILAILPQTVDMSEAARLQLGGVFVDRLLGSDLLRALLGLAPTDEADRRRRAEGARDELLRRLEQRR